MNRQLKILAKLPFAPVVAAMFGTTAFILILMTPNWMLERIVVASGLPLLIAAAQPPLGQTALKLSAVVGGLGVFSALWAGLALLGKLIKRNAAPKARGSRIEAAQPPAESPLIKGKRKPIFAERELGAPFMSDEAIAHVAESQPIVQTNATPPPQSPEETLLLTHTIDPEQEEVGNALSDELTRLQSALDRRAARGLSARPLAGGDIATIRKALNVLN
jgi:hypothetical protein